MVAVVVVAGFDLSWRCDVDRVNPLVFALGRIELAGRISRGVLRGWCSRFIIAIE